VNILGSASLPRITTQQGEPKVVGGRLILTWRLTVSHMTYDEYQTLMGVVQTALVQEIRYALDGTPHATGGASVLFRLAEWDPGTPIQVYVTSFSEDRTPMQGPTGWDKSGREVHIDLEEA